MLKVGTSFCNFLIFYKLAVTIHFLLQCLMESGKLLPGSKVIIANPDTKGQCGDSHLGEVWLLLIFKR